MNNNRTKQHWLKLGAIALLTFISTFLAFYIVMEIMYNRITDPTREIKRFEKMIKQEGKILKKYENRITDNPFEPKMQPTMINLVKEPNEYKIIIDLNQLNNDEKSINVDFNGNEINLSGQADKRSLNTEKIISFSQTYFLDESPDKEKITKEKKGNKYIITIPFKNNEGNKTDDDD